MERAVGEVCGKTNVQPGRSSITVKVRKSRIYRAESILLHMHVTLNDGGVRRMQSSTPESTELLREE
jgi:hypothetical protein